MPTKTKLVILSAAAFLTTTTVVTAQTTRPAVLKAWTFNKPGDTQGWTPNGDVKSLAAKADGLHFETTGTDPLLQGPVFDPIPATNNQVVEIEIECDEGGGGEFFYTNKTTGQYGGFEPKWMSHVVVPAAKKPGDTQTVTIWPFWAELGKIIHIRFDPPAGTRCRLVSIRIADQSNVAARETRWYFKTILPEGWRSMSGIASITPQADGVAISSRESQGLLMVSVRPFDAATKPLLIIDAEAARDVAFYWVTQEARGLHGMNVSLPQPASSSDGIARIDLRSHPVWKGTITQIGIGPTDQTMILRSVELKDVHGPAPSATAKGPAAQPRRSSKPMPPQTADYVPAPRPVKTDYDIGVYYFPGWSPDRPDGTSSRWDKQAGFPERDPLLGWYREGDPEVADWHIKWAVENGIRFFIYDWYWRDGRVELEKGLHDGFLKARYRDQLKFCLMWANHPPFSSHTKEQFIQVADYWVEHYLRLPNYYRIDGRPYVSFFHIGELRKCFGTDEKLRDALAAMRQRVQAAGLPGLYIVACGDAGRATQEWYKKVGFDAVTAYNYPSAGAVTTQSPYAPFIRAHEDIWRSAQRAGIIRYIPLLTVGWDSRPWAGPDAPARFGRTTARLAEGLKRLRAFMDETGQKVGILEAWNEFGEGSYIEPNREFGFEDLDAIRRTFAEPADWPANIAPQDVGLGPYDVRAMKTTSDDGPAIVPTEHRLEVYPGKASIDGKIVTAQTAILDAPPIEIRRITIEDYALVAGAVNNWMGGNRLWTDPAHGRQQLLPGSFVPGSLRIESHDAARTTFTEPNDYTVDTKWGAFALTPSGRLRPGDHLRITYELSLRRVDTVVVDEAGKPRYLSGEALADCPLPPAPPPHTAHLANVYRPFNAGGVQRYEVYPIVGQEPKTPRAYTGARPVRTIEKLRKGEPVTIVCWGDSVTACGESSTPDKCYVALLETRLKKLYPNAQIRVVNAGIGASNSETRKAGFQKEVLDFKPDLVTLEFVNDMGLPDDVLQRNYEQILQRLSAAGAELILITPHFTMPEWMELPHGRGPEKRRGVMFLRKFAAEHAVPLADASKRWEDLQDLGVPYETLLRNGINHPDDRGHAIFADELIRVLGSD